MMHSPKCDFRTNIRVSKAINVTKITMTTSVTTVIRVIIGTTATITKMTTKAIGQSRSHGLYKIVDVSFLTSQKLQVANPSFEAQSLLYLSQAIVHTFIKSAHPNSISITSSCNDNKLLNQYQCLENFEII